MIRSVRRGLVLGFVTGFVLPAEALATWGEENWGTMLWRAAPTPVPTGELLGLAILALVLACGAAWILRRRAWAMSVLLVALAVPLVVVAGTVELPNTFENGQVADADQVNANFNACKTAVDDNDTQIEDLKAQIMLICCYPGIPTACPPPMIEELCE